MAPAEVPELALQPDHFGGYVAAMQTRNPDKVSHCLDAHAIVHYDALHLGGHLDLDASHDDALHVVHAAGRGSRVRIPAGWLSLCLSLSDRLQLESSDGFWELPNGHMQVWREGSLRVDCRSSGGWLGLTGPLATWTRHLHALAQGAHPGFVRDIFPHESRCSRDLRRLLVHLARCARGTPAAAGDPGVLVETTCLALIEQQRDLHERLQRCNGRTAQRRHQTLMRLLRVRHLIEINGDDRPDLARLARSANYSPWHLIRMHRHVFDQTPSEYAARLRLERAWSLVHDTQLPICEITEALGFESQSSFCRAFKHAYGATTSEVRHGHAMAKPLHRALPASPAALATTRAA